MPTRPPELFRAKPNEKPMEYDPQTISHEAAYKLLIGSVIPRPIAWVSTTDGRGNHNIGAFSFFNAICPAPMLLSFAPMRNDDQQKKDTLRNIETTGVFVINLVDEGLLEKMDLTGIPYPAEVDEFAVAGLTPQASTKIVAPLIQEAPISFECSLYQVLHFGEPDGAGSLVIGEVVYVHVKDRVLVEGRIDPNRLRPIARMGGPLYARPEILPYRRKG